MDNLSGKYLGEKKIKFTEETGEKTPNGVAVVSVVFEDGSTIWMSSLMLNNTATDEALDLSKLREKRIFPVVELVLALLRDWGVMIGELPYLSAVLNQSLDFNSKEAALELWSDWMPKPLSIDEVDLITVDRVLTLKKRTLKDVLGNQNQSESV